MSNMEAKKITTVAQRKRLIEALAHKAPKYVTAQYVREFMDSEGYEARPAPFYGALRRELAAHLAARRIKNFEAVAQELVQKKMLPQNPTRTHIQAAARALGHEISSWTVHDIRSYLLQQHPALFNRLDARPKPISANLYPAEVEILESVKKMTGLRNTESLAVLLRMMTLACAMGQIDLIDLYPRARSLTDAEVRACLRFFDKLDLRGLY